MCSSTRSVDCSCRGRFSGGGRLQRRNEMFGQSMMMTIVTVADAWTGAMKAA